MIIFLFFCFLCHIPLQFENRLLHITLLILLHYLHYQCHPGHPGHLSHPGHPDQTLHR